MENWLSIFVYIFPQKKFIKWNLRVKMIWPLHQENQSKRNKRMDREKVKVKTNLKCLRVMMPSKIDQWPDCLFVFLIFVIGLLGVLIVFISAYFHAKRIFILKNVNSSQHVQASNLINSINWALETHAVNRNSLKWLIKLFLFFL